MTWVRERSDFFELAESRLLEARHLHIRCRLKRLSLQPVLIYFSKVLPPLPLGDRVLNSLRIPGNIPMRLYRLLLSLLFVGTALAQSSDPFIGTWVYDAEKSPTPLINYAIKDLGGDRYALTGSTGETTEIKADGNTIKSPSGDPVSFRKVDAQTWHMDRANKDGSGKMARTYTVSPDDIQLTLTDVFTSKEGIESESVTRYHRTSTGKSIYGQWRSFSLKTTVSRPSEFLIEQFGKEGLSMTSLSDKHRTDMLFDGKPYIDQGPGGPLETTTSGKRLDPHLLQLESRTKGVLDETDEFKVSDDGNTLTIVSKQAKSSAIFTSVWDKK